MDRLQKVLARAGVASRRHAEALIAAGRVRVNGQVVTTLGTRVDPATATIAVDSRPLAATAVPVYLALNKPQGYVTTVQDPQGRPTVMDLVPRVPGLFPVGRLDADSAGLLLLTTDGEWAQRTSHPRYGSEKEYLVETVGRVAPQTLEVLRRPMVLAPGDRTTGAQVDVVRHSRDRTVLRIVLHEGRNRQVRRMLEQVGHPVLSLRRVRVAGVRLGDLPEGAWRHLAPQELDEGRRTKDESLVPSFVLRPSSVRLRRRPA